MSADSVTRLDLSTLAEVTPQGITQEEFARMVVCLTVAADSSVTLADLQGRPAWYLPGSPCKGLQDTQSLQGSESKNVSAEAVPVRNDGTFEVVLRELRSLGYAELWSDGRFTLTSKGEQLAERLGR